MLREPEIDEALTALDRAVVEAVRARLAAGGWLVRQPPPRARNRST